MERQIKISGMDLLFLEVNSLEESLAFYNDQLGFEVDSNNPATEPPMATLRAGNLRITLAQNLETMLRRGARRTLFSRRGRRRRLLSATHR